MTAGQQLDGRAELRGRFNPNVCGLSQVKGLARDETTDDTLPPLAEVGATIEPREATAGAPCNSIETGRAVLAGDDAAITLVPRRAVVLAGEPIAAALPKLGAP